MSLSPWDVLTIPGAAQRCLGPAIPPRSGGPGWQVVLRPDWGGRGAAGTSLRVLRAPLCSSAQRPDNGWCCRGPSHLLAALSGIPGAGPRPRRQRLRGQGFRAQPRRQERRGFAFMQISHVLLARRRCTGKDVSCVWFWVGGSGSGLSWAWARDYGERPPRPLPPPATSPQHNHTRSYCWCHSFSAKIALKNSLGPSSNRSTAGMC